VRKTMISRELVFCVFEVQNKDEGSLDDLQYYSEVSVPRILKKSRKFGRVAGWLGGCYDLGLYGG